MKIRVQLILESADGAEPETITEEIGCFSRANEGQDLLGLSLAESKELLSELQKRLITQQITMQMRSFSHCDDCGQPRRRNGQQQITYRTLFGNMKLKGQRYYHCECQSHPTKTLNPLTQLVPERTSPEFAFLQAKWASLVSYGMTVKLLEDVLPLQANVASTMRKTQQTAERIEEELGEEQHVYIDGSARQISQLPDPSDRLCVGIDGGFVRGRADDTYKAGHFEVIVGKSLADDCPSKRFAFVQTYDEKPKRRLYETLKSQGMQMNQDITFLSDGGDDVRELQYYLNPNAEHLLDWFHVTMKITVMKQMAKGINDKTVVEKALATLHRIKYRLWHGHVETALLAIGTLQELCHADDDEDVTLKYKQLHQAAEAFETYIRNNAHFITNYAERHRYGERISTGFVESTVNEVVSKRMVKKQQMRWTRKGAHLLLQVRIKTLNDDLRGQFETWYPPLAAAQPIFNGSVQHTV